MAVDIEVVTITHAIQQAVAPVFLLAGIGGILNVLTNRLARIIDRSRNLHHRLETVSEER
ncbi:MAG: NADH/NAD ratio-sensing transcriptional regulator Rex, partial [Zhongshania marina]